MPWVSYGQKGEGTKTSGSWQPYGTKKKQDKKKAVIEESLKQAEKYQAEAEKYAGRVNMIEGIGKTLVRPFVSLAEIPKNVYGSVAGKQNTFGDVNVPGLGKVQSYQEDAKWVTGGIIEGKKPLYSILKPMGSAIIDTAGLGIGSSVAKGVTKEAFKQTAKRLIPEGAAYGLGQGAVDSIGNGRTYGEKAKDIATSTAFGAVGAPLFGVGFNVIGRAVSSLGSKLSGRATKYLDPKEVKSTVDEIVGIVDRDLKPEEEQAVMEALSRGATQEELVTEVGKAKVEKGLEPNVRLAQVVDELESGGKKLSFDEIATVKKGMDEGKSFEEIQSTLEPQKALSTAPKEETGATVPKDTSDNGDEAFLKAVEERFKASKTNKFREATKDEKGRFTGSKSEKGFKTGDAERDDLSQAIQNRMDSLKDGEYKSTQENFDNESALQRFEEIQNKIPRAKVEDLPALKKESDDITKELLDKRAKVFRPLVAKDEKVRVVGNIAKMSDTFPEFRANLKRSGYDEMKLFDDKAAAETFFNRSKGAGKAKYRVADEDPLPQEARKYGNKGLYDKNYEKFINENRKSAKPFDYDVMERAFGTTPEVKGDKVKVYRMQTGGTGKLNDGDNVSIYDFRKLSPEAQRKMGVDEVVKNKDAEIFEQWIDKDELYQTDAGTQLYKPKADPLIQEARKYKTAEEFLKAQGEPVYHASSSPIDAFGDVPDSGTRFYGKGTYFSNNIERTREFGDNVTEARLSIKNPYKEGDTYNEEMQKQILKLFGKKEGSKIINSKIILDATKVNGNLLAEMYKKAGYDGVIARGGNDIAVFDPKNSVKTKSQLTEIWKKAHGEKFRDIAPRFEELTGTKITPEQEAQIKSLHKRMFGDENVEITAQILTPEGQKAFGVYKNKVIKILDGQVDPTDTFYHEAVHKYLDLFTTLDEQKNIYLEARKLWKTDNLDELEEKIAENFIRYAKENEGVVGTMKVLFDKVIDRIKNALKGESKIEALYRDILEGKAVKNEVKETVPKQVVPKEKKVSIIASRLNKDLPPDFRIDETYDPKAINKEADKAAELIAENKTKAIQKALDTGTNPMERDAILIELSEIAKRDKDYGTLNDLFNKRSELIRSGAQSLNMEKASILLNPQEQYMRNVVNAKLGKVKISGKDLTPETLAAKRTGIRKETKDVVRRSFKIEDAQELFDKLLCK